MPCDMDFRCSWDTSDGACAEDETMGEGSPMDAFAAGMAASNEQSHFLNKLELFEKKFAKKRYQT